MGCNAVEPSRIAVLREGSVPIGDSGRAEEITGSVPVASGNRIHQSEHSSLRGCLPRSLDPPEVYTNSSALRPAEATVSASLSSSQRLPSGHGDGHLCDQRTNHQNHLGSHRHHGIINTSKLQQPQVCQQHCPAHARQANDHDSDLSSAEGIPAANGRQAVQHHRLEAKRSSREAPNPERGPTGGL
uniref:(northern house mosquito) hypothetical protein n=1 Tax=Culex pipiens TaxID=7175 RepID=A0A8D8ARM9_CULPI